MLWRISSSRNRGASSESDASDRSDLDDVAWTRSSKAPKPPTRRYRRSSERPSSSWFASFFTPNNSPASTRKKSSKRGKKLKYRKWFIRPQTSHEWGLVSFVLLLVGSCVSAVVLSFWKRTDTFMHHYYFIVWTAALNCFIGHLSH